MVSYVDSTTRDVVKQLTKDAFWSTECPGCGRKENGEKLRKAINETLYSKTYAECVSM